MANALKMQKKKRGKTNPLLKGFSFSKIHNGIEMNSFKTTYIFISYSKTLKYAVKTLLLTIQLIRLKTFDVTF